MGAVASTGDHLEQIFLLRQASIFAAQGLSAVAAEVEETHPLTRLTHPPRQHPRILQKFRTVNLKSIIKPDILYTTYRDIFLGDLLLRRCELIWLFNLLKFCCLRV